MGNFTHGVSQLPLRVQFWTFQVGFSERRKTRAELDIHLSNCKTKQSSLLKKGKVEGLELIIDRTFTPLPIRALSGTATFAIVLIVLIFATSGNPSSGLLVYGSAINLTSYAAYIIWLGFIIRSSRRP